jgi:MFS family permease
MTRLRAERQRVLSSLDRSTWFLIGGNALSSVGTGLVLPFTVVYLAYVRDVPLPVAGLIVGSQPLCSVLAAPLAGWMIDKRSSRFVMITAQIIAAAGSCVMAFATGPVLALVASALLGVGWAGSFVGIRALIGRTVPEPDRRTAFALQNALFNLGAGVGGVLAGFAADIDDVTSFTILFLANAMSFLAYAALLTRTGADAPRHTTGSEATPRQPDGYSRVLADRLFLSVLGISFVLIFAGWAQQEATLPPYMVLAGASTHAIGVGFAVNTLAIVVAQIPILRLLNRLTTTNALIILSLIWAGVWVIVVMTGVFKNTAINPFGFILAFAIFSLGECIFSGTIPDLVNKLAPDGSIGRYNGVYAVVNTAARAAGPAFGGVLLAGPHPQMLFVLLAVFCVVAGAATLVLSNSLESRVSSFEPP